MQVTLRIHLRFYACNHRRPPGRTAAIGRFGPYLESAPDLESSIQLLKSSAQALQPCGPSSSTAPSNRVGISLEFNGPSNSRVIVPSDGVYSRRGLPAWALRPTCLGALPTSDAQRPISKYTLGVYAGRQMRHVTRYIADFRGTCGTVDNFYARLLHHMLRTKYTKTP